ncbi:MAG: hypothetical protein NPIRA06_12150 [Nitrospirales bacterium]|nr:MAG: hypothetical protein NPIRA06_12150 [Nitrospirales bacterium]
MNIHRKFALESQPGFCSPFEEPCEVDRRNHLSELFRIFVPHMDFRSFGYERFTNQVFGDVLRHQFFLFEGNEMQACENLKEPLEYS